MAILQKYDAELAAAWASSPERASKHRELNDRTAALILVAVDSITHRATSSADQHVNDAFDAGSNVAEILELLIRIGMLEGGIHSIHDGLEALDRVVVHRERSGMPAPRRGEGLTEADREPEHSFPVPPVYPYQTPRVYLQAWQKYDPDLHRAYFDFLAKRFALRRELRKRTEEVVVVAVDALILWPAPLIDSHFHEAFNVGSNVQELLEAVVTVAQYQGGNAVLDHGLLALNRVVSERETMGAATPLSGKR
jgi:alkylhydroperoxidase/carboxymuconolactone decarboxylase family protein YurZ